MANETVSQWGNHVPEVIQQVKGKAATITVWFDLNMKSLSSLAEKDLINSAHHPHSITPTLCPTPKVRCLHAP